MSHRKLLISQIFERSWNAGMKQKSGGGRKGGGGPILINKENRPGGKESILETAAGDAYYNNPNVSFRLF